MAEKSKYWVGVCYPENMLEDWEIEIGDILQFPYAYCIHDKDLDKEKEDRKKHVHIILAFNNTTTYNHAFNVFSRLNKLGCVCVNRVEQVINIRQMFEYLIHNTETCKKQGKYLYDKKERVTGNNFDIGSYEQISAAEKDKMLMELANDIMQQSFVNFADFYFYVMSNYEDDYFQILKGYSGFLERLTKGNFQRMTKKAAFEDSPIYTTNTP